jgi:hypothetical protein
MPAPYDLEETELTEYKNLDPRWHQWETVKTVAVDLAIVIFDQVSDARQDDAAP